jgi:hypothetical protein
MSALEGDDFVTSDVFQKVLRRGCPGLCRVRPCCAPRRPRDSFPVIVINRQEVRPMNAVSIVGAPLQSTIARLR